MATVRVIAKPVFSALNKLSRQVKATPQASVGQLVELGVRHAAAYVPKDTMQLMRAIRGKYSPSSKGAKGVIDIQLETHTDVSAKRRTSGRVTSVPRTTHDLARIMSEPRYSGHFTTGNPQFMKATRAYLNRIAQKTTIEIFNKFI